MSVQAFLYVVAVILIVLAALPLPTRGVSLALLVPPAPCSPTPGR